MLSDERWKRSKMLNASEALRKQNQARAGAFTPLKMAPAKSLIWSSSAGEDPAQAEPGARGCILLPPSLHWRFSLNGQIVSFNRQDFKGETMTKWHQKTFISNILECSAS